MIKVMHFLSDTNVGGAGILLTNLLSSIDKRNFDFSVVLPKGSKMKDRIEDIGIPVTELRISSDRSFSIPDILPITAHISRFRPDIIHTHGMLSARIAGTLSRVPVRIASRHCSYGPGRLARPVLHPLVRLADRTLGVCTIATAHAAKKDLTDMGIEDVRVRVIINGSRPLRRLSEEEKRELRRSLNIPEDAFVSIMAARLEQVKGHETLLLTARELCREQEGWYFLIVGTGSLQDELRSRAREYGIENNVIFTGFSDDIAPFMNIADVNVNCSVGTETSCLALSEGMSLGIPAVATEYGGNVYMVRGGINGYLFPPRDSITLGNILRLLRHDHTSRQALSRGAYDMYEKHFRSSAMAEEYRNLYLDLYSQI